MLPGTYTARVESPGVKELVRGGIELRLEVGLGLLEREAHQPVRGQAGAREGRARLESWGLGMMLQRDHGLGSATWLDTNPKARRILSHAGIGTAPAVGDPDAGEIRRKSIDAACAPVG